MFDKDVVWGFNMLGGWWEKVDQSVREHSHYSRSSISTSHQSKQKTRKEARTMFRWKAKHVASTMELEDVSAANSALSDNTCIFGSSNSPFCASESAAFNSGQFGNCRSSPQPKFTWNEPMIFNCHGMPAGIHRGSEEALDGSRKACADDFTACSPIKLEHANDSTAAAAKDFETLSVSSDPRAARASDFSIFSGSGSYACISNRRYETIWSGIIPFVGYHHVLMLLIAISIILLAFLLAGCSSSSPGIDNIFLISLYYQNYVPYMDPSQVDTSVFSSIANIVGRAQLEVRVGYFGICVSPNGGGFLCSNNASALAEQVMVDQDPLNLIYVANTFKNSIVFPYLLIIGIIFAFVCFLLLATFPGWHEEIGDDDETRDVKPFPSRPVSQVALALIFVASVFVLVSVLWQHTASISASQVAQDLGNGSIKSGIGTSALALGWISFALLILVTIGLLAMILSIRVLTDTLVDDD